MPIGLRHVISGILAGGIPGFRMVLLLLHSPSGMAWWFFGFFLFFLLPYHVETIQCYHLLHELAHELAPVTPWFCSFVLCRCFLFAWFWWVCFWLVFGLFWWWLHYGLLACNSSLLMASQSADGHVYALINSCSPIWNMQLNVLNDLAEAMKALDGKKMQNICGQQQNFPMAGPTFGSKSGPQNGAQAKT